MKCSVVFSKDPLLLTRDFVKAVGKDFKKDLKRFQIQKWQKTGVRKILLNEKINVDILLVRERQKRKSERERQR